MKLRWALLALVAAVVVGGGALAQSLPLRLVQAGDGTLWVLADRVKHRITPDQIGDQELAGLPEGEPWAGTIGEAAVPASPAVTSPDGVLVRSVTSVAFRLPSGAVRAAGVIENAGQFPAAGIEVTVSLVDRGGAEVGAAQAANVPYVLLPGTRAGWAAPVDAGPPFAEARVRVSAKPRSPGLAESVVQNFRLEGVEASRAFAEQETPKIRGRVVNEGGATATSVRILASVYDRDGSLLDVYLGRAQVAEIPPGQSSPFVVDTSRSRVGPEIARYDLFVEGFAKP